MLEIQGITAGQFAKQFGTKGNEKSGFNDDLVNLYMYDTSMWNPILFAIYYKRTDIVIMMLREYSQNIIMSIRMPPPTEFIEYILPN